MEVEVFNPLDASDKSGIVLCGTCHYLFWCSDTVTLKVSSKFKGCSKVYWIKVFISMSWSFFMNMRLRKILHTTLVWNRFQTHRFQLVFHSVSQFIHLTRMRRFGWATTSWIFNKFGNCCLSFSINYVRSVAKRVLHFALICFRLFTRLLVIFDCFCTASCSPEAFDKSCLPAKFSFPHFTFLGICFRPQGVLW